MSGTGSPRLVLVLFALLLPLSFAAAQSPAEDSARARLLFEQKKYADAASLLETIRREGHPAPMDLILLGTCYTQLNELDKAAAVLDEAALIAPQNVSLLNARGNLAFVRKKFADSLELFRQAHRLDPEDRNAVAGMVAALSNHGVELFGQGKVDDARKEFQEAVQLNPHSVPALRNMGILELEKGDPAVAAQYFERALSISPGDVGLLKLLFLVRNRQGDTKTMMPILDRLIDAEPGDPEPYAAKGRLLELDGKKQEALEVFREAVDKGSQDPLPYLRVGEAQRDRYLLHDAVARAVQLISALEIGASQAIGTSGKPGDLQGAKLITSKIEDVRVTLASSLSLLRQIDGDSLFAQDLARLQSWYPGSVDLLVALGRLYQEKENWRDALAVWQTILKDHPLDEEAQAGAGLALEKLGDTEQAITAYRRARELLPKAPELYSALERLYAGREDDLRQVLLDISYRETRNVVLLRELAKVEGDLGLQADSVKHLSRVSEIESGK
ncbi:MAG: tetratricopeptide repeat protein [Spirochaetia bacterium]